MNYSDGSRTARWLNGHWVRDGAGHVLDGFTFTPPVCRGCAGAGVPVRSRAHLAAFPASVTAPDCRSVLGLHTFPATHFKGTYRQGSVSSRCVYFFQTNVPFKSHIYRYPPICQRSPRTL